MAPGATFTVALPDLKPEADPVMWVVPPNPGVTVMLTPVEPSGTVALAGTLAAVELLLFKATTWPPVPAGVDRIILRVLGVFVRFNGSGVSVMVGKAAVIDTVTGKPLVNPSFTIN